MTDFRTQLKERDTRRLAPVGEGCALFSALVSLVFVFFIGFRERYGGRLTLYAVMRGSAFGGAAGGIALGAVTLLSLFTAVRYVRFLRGSSKKDSLYFCYAVYFSYLAGIMLVSAVCAGKAVRIDGATAAGVLLGGAGIIASAVLFLIAKGKERGREAASRFVCSALSLLFLLALFALFSLGAVTDGDRMGLAVLFEEAPPAAAVCFFLFLIAFAACAVLLLERLAGNIAQRRKPTLLRAALTAACGIAAALCGRSLASAPDEMHILFVWGVPGAAMLLCGLLLLCALADFLLARLGGDPKNTGANIMCGF